MKQKTRILIATMLIMSMVIGQNTFIFAASAKKTKPQLSKTKVVMEIGTTKKLTVKKIQKKAKITWKSSNSKVVKVTKKGKLVAKNPGKAVIKATVKQNNKKTVLKCKVLVNRAKEISTVDLPKKNDLFDEVAKMNVIKIDCFIGSPSYIVTNPKKISNVINYLSSLEIEEKEYDGIPRDGWGISMTFIAPDKKFKITTFSTDFWHEGKLYGIKNSNINITEELKKLIYE